MKFLYVGLDPVDFDSVSFRQDVLLKFGGVKQLGNDVDYICHDQRNIFSCVRGETKRTEFTESPHFLQEFYRYVLEFLKERTYDVLYMKSLMLCPAQIKIAESVKAKKFGAKVIYEPTRYPAKEYFKELLQQSREKGGMKAYTEMRARLMRHKMCEARLSRVADTLVVLEMPVNSIWGVPAIAVNNGISTSQVRVRSNSEELGDPIAILAVVDDPKICGYDRIFRGLNAYRHNRRREQVTIDIVGRDEETRDLREMAVKWNVEQLVNFLGEKTIPEINELCNTHTIAFSSLGLFHTGRIYYSPYITRLFCAAGIPFVYAYEDVGLSVKVPFALKMPNLDAPISMEMVGEFVWRCRLNTRLTQQERRFAEDNYDWRVIMKQILEFTATGKLEV